MMVRAFLFVLGVMLAAPAFAQSVKLTAEQITELLTGNTAIGKWEGNRYRQFFGVDGVTIYAQEGARSTRGEWRVNATTDEYQSIWPNDADWESWVVIEYAGAYYWANKETPPTPFRVEEGERLVK